MSSSHQTRLKSRAWYRRVVLGIFAVVILAGVVLGQTGGVVHAATLPYNDNGHTENPPLVFYNATQYSSIFVQHDPKLYLVFWGPDWADGQADASQRQAIVADLEALAGSAFNNVLTQYTDSTDKVHNDARVMAAVVDTTVPPNTIDIGIETPAGVYLNEQGRSEADKEIAAHSWPVNQDAQVIMFPQQGTTYLAGNSWCGMHVYNSTAASPYAYSLIQYGDQNSGCKPVGDTPDDIAWTAIHEYAEMATDPEINGSLSFSWPPAVVYGGGWHTQDSSLTSPEEVADLCEGYSTNSSQVSWPDYRSVSTGYTYDWPLLWSNSANGCATSQGQEFKSPDTTFPFTGKHTVQGAILGKYTAGGGVNYPAALGEPLTEEVPIDGGAVSYFANQVDGGGYPLPSSVTSAYGGSGKTAGSAIYYHSGQGVHEVHGYIFADYVSAGGPAGLGFPVSDEVDFSGGAVSYFAGQLCGSASSHPDGSGSAVYYDGSIHQANFVRGCVYNRYQTACGDGTTQTCYQVLGLPVTSEIGLSNGGVVSYFAGQICNGGFGTLTPGVYTGSAIYYDSATGTHEVQGCIFTEYTSLGGPFSDLGYPTSDEQVLSGGWVSNFQGTGCFSLGSFGQIYSSSAGTHEVNGCIDWAYLKLGGYGSLGFPTSNEFTNSCGEPESDFQHAKLVWNGTDVVSQSLSTNC